MARAYAAGDSLRAYSRLMGMPDGGSSHCQPLGTGDLRLESSPRSASVHLPLRGWCVTNDLANVGSVGDGDGGVVERRGAVADVVGEVDPGTVEVGVVEVS